MSIPSEGPRTEAIPEARAPQPFNLVLPELELRILAGAVSAPRDLRCYLGGIIALFIITCFASPFLLERPAPGAAAGYREEVPEVLRPTYDRAIHGDADAMRILGHMYYQGLRVPRDIQEGIQWYHRAAAAGSPEAVHDLERLGLPLSN
jgi:TPR repeat protein